MRRRHEIATDSSFHARRRPTLGFPADVMREASVVGGVYGAQLPDIDDPRTQAVRALSV
jgi:hypothetical protein